MRGLRVAAVALGCGAAGCLMAVPWFPTLWGGVALALAGLVAVSLDSLFVWTASEREAEEAARLRREIEMTRKDMQSMVAVYSTRFEGLEALTARHESMIESLNRKQAIQAIR